MQISYLNDDLKMTSMLDEPMDSALLRIVLIDNMWKEYEEDKRQDKGALQ